MKSKDLTSLLAAVIVCAASAANLRADDTAAYQPFTVGGVVGTTGFGGSGSWRFSDHLGVRAEFDTLRYSHNQDIENVNYDLNLRLRTQPGTLDIYPWTSSSFRISVGAAFNQNRLTGTGNSTDGTYNLNGQTFPAASVGTLNLLISQKPIDPYLSIGGNLYFDHGHHVSLGGELGAFYTGKARVSLSRSGGVADATIDAALEAEQDKVQSYANKAIIWPVAKIGVFVSF